LTTYQGGLRKLAEREADVRVAARRVPAEDLEVIIRKVAADSGAEVDELRRATGIQ
jgi:hypothetical protein